MLKIRNPVLILGFFLIIGSLTSCVDNCKKVICKNGGQCYEGICDCPTGYEGDSCTLETREKFLGTYNVTDNCTVTGTPVYTVNISPDEFEILEVNIANFNNDFSNSVHAIITGETIKIPAQFPDMDGRSVSGSGIFIGGSTISWSYTITNPGNPSNACNGSIWVK